MRRALATHPFTFAGSGCGTRYRCAERVLPGGGARDGARLGFSLAARRRRDWRWGSCPAAAASYDRFLAALDRADAARIDAAVAELRRVGTPFSAAVSAPEGSAFAFKGDRRQRRQRRLDHRCLGDQAGRGGARSRGGGAAPLRDVLEMLPLPVWRRDGALRIVDCNTAFAAALDQPREAVLAEPSELAPDNDQGEAPALAKAAAAGTVAARPPARRDRRRAPAAGA